MNCAFVPDKMPVSEDAKLLSDTIKDQDAASWSDDPQASSSSEDERQEEDEKEPEM